MEEDQWTLINNHIILRAVRSVTTFSALIKQSIRATLSKYISLIRKNKKKKKLIFFKQMLKVFSFNSLLKMGHFMTCLLIIKTLQKILVLDIALIKSYIKFFVKYLDWPQYIRRLCRREWNPHVGTRSNQSGIFLCAML